MKHLGHILHFKLDDGPDILRAIKDLNKKANSMLYTFRSADPVVKTFLIKMYCLSLYGCHTWSLSSKCLFHIQVAMNKILRKVWNLPHRSHTSIVHCTADIPAICNIVYSRFCTTVLCTYCFFHHLRLVYTFLGYNNLYGSHHLKFYSNYDFDILFFVRSVRLYYGFNSPFENFIRDVVCT